MSQISPSKKSHLGAVYLQKRSNGDVPDTINPRQQAPPGVAGRKKVTKGNKVLASGALSGAHELIEMIARRASIYEPQRVMEANLEVVRDTGFEPVTSCV